MGKVFYLGLAHGRALKVGGVCGGLGVCVHLQARMQMVELKQGFDWEWTDFCDGLHDLSHSLKPDANQKSGVNQK